MPINQYGMGYSINTFYKENDFYYIIYHILKIIRGREVITGKQIPFIYIDLFSGCGENKDIYCDGSPLLAVKAIKKSKISNYVLFLNDINKECCEKLNTLIQEPNAIISNKSFDEILINPPPILLNKTGVLFIDGNGVSYKRQTYFKFIKEFYEKKGTDKIDLIFRISATNYKRSMVKYNYPDLIDEMRKINKLYWYLKSPSKDAFQWVTLFATNTNEIFKNNKSSFYKADSAKGSRLLNKINQTNYDPYDKYFHNSKKESDIIYFNCEWCGKQTPKKGNKKYCSSECSRLAMLNNYQLNEKPKWRCLKYRILINGKSPKKCSSCDKINCEYKHIGLSSDFENVWRTKYYILTKSEEKP